MVRRFDTKHTKCVSPDVLVDRADIETVAGVGRSGSRRGYRFSRIAEGTPSVTVAAGETPLASQQRQMNP